MWRRRRQDVAGINDGALAAIAEAWRLVQSRERTQALEVVANAKRRWPGVALLWDCSSSLHLGAGDYQAALADAAVALALDPYRGPTRITVAVILRDKGYAEAALAVAQAAGVKGPLHDEFIALFSQPPPVLGDTAPGCSSEGESGGTDGEASRRPE
jgi:hypothetical protein